MDEIPDAGGNGGRYDHATDTSVVVGYIYGVWGIAGDLKVEVLSDFPERFSPGSVLYIDGSPARVERSRPTKSGLVVKLDSINDRTTAEAQRGKFLTIRREDVGDLPEGSFYYFQVLDMDVRTESGEYLGRVQEIISTPGNDIYVVRNDGEEVLVPALDGVVLSVDLQQNLLVVRLPEVL